MNSCCVHLHVLDWYPKQVRRGWIICLFVVAACGRRGFEPGSINGDDTQQGDDAAIDDDADDGSLVSPCGSGGCQWSAGEFGACSLSCTTGTQTRNVECVDPDGQPVAEMWCDGAARPAASQACMETGCSWNASSWSSCSVNCGGGNQMRTVECRASSGMVVTDGYCTGTKPSAMQSCNTQACCVDLNNTIHELPGDGARACSTDIRYFTTNDGASVMRRCTELGYAMYGNFVQEFTNAQWCMYCNARTKIWNGSAWTVNGCTRPVNVLRCCNNP